jgi:hypothetical protein
VCICENLSDGTIIFSISFIFKKSGTI